MVNSATQALAEFKNQRMGGLLSGTASTVASAPIKGTSLTDTAGERLARSMPKKSTTQFMDQLRQRNSQINQQALQGIQNRQAQITGVAGPTRGPGTPGNPGAMRSGYQLPAAQGKPQTGGARGQYGLTLPAAQAFNAMSAAAQRAGVGGLSIASGGRTYAQQAALYAAYKAGRGNLAAPPGQSLHESGIAADFGGSAHYYSGAQHAWLRQNAATFGWYWVGKNFSQREDWHWEYHPEWNK